MKTFIIAIIVLLILGVGGYFAFKIIKNQALSNEPGKNLVQTLDGVLTPIQFNGQYSDVITSGGTVTGVTSSTLDLKPYENKKVHITGEYSGNTMYADTVTIIP